MHLLITFQRTFCWKEKVHSIFSICGKFTKRTARRMEGNGNRSSRTIMDQFNWFRLFIAGNKINVVTNAQQMRHRIAYTFYFPLLTSFFIAWKHYATPRIWISRSEVSQPNATIGKVTGQRLEHCITPTANPILKMTAPYQYTSKHRNYTFHQTGVLSRKAKFAR